MGVKPKRKYCIECDHAIQNSPGDTAEPYTDTSQTAFCDRVLDPVTKLPAACSFVRTRTEPEYCGVEGRYFKARS